jgi:hypothetical protein
VALKNNNATTTFLFFGVIRDFLIVFLSFLIEDINIYSKFDYIIFFGLIERFVLNYRIFSYIHTTAPGRHDNDYDDGWMLHFIRIPNP